MDDLLGPGLGESQRAILELLKRRGKATLAELESGLELARETLRDHLKALAAAGLAQRAGVRREGPGRPQVVYRLGPRGEELFPHREGELLRELATFLLEQGNGQLLESFFDQRATGKRERLRRRVEGLHGMERLRQVAQALSEEGFVAEASEPAAGRLRLRLCHCALREVVNVSQLPCRAEMALVEELLGAALTRESFMPDGDASCTYTLAARAESAIPTTHEPKEAPR